MKFDFANTNTLVNIYQKLNDRFDGNIVITLEGNGVLYTVNKEIKLLPALEITDIKDTTAAGDVFHGAFAYGFASGFDIEKTIKIANIAAGLSIKKLGTRDAVPELAEVMAEYEK